MGHRIDHEHVRDVDLEAALTTCAYKKAAARCEEHDRNSEHCDKGIEEKARKPKQGKGDAVARAHGEGRVLARADSLDGNGEMLWDEAEHDEEPHQHSERGQTQQCNAGVL